MPLRSRKLSVEVTVNGNGFDAPTSINIKKGRGLYTATLQYPESSSMRYRIFGDDIVRIYMEEDGFTPLSSNHIPVFVGYKSGESGLGETELKLSSLMYPLSRRYLALDGTFNVDGYTPAGAIRKLLDKAEFPFPFYATETGGNAFPIKNLRSSDPRSVLELIFQIRDMAVVPSDPLRGLYSIFECNERVYFRPRPNPEEEEAQIPLIYGDTLLELSETSDEDSYFNAIRVIGDKELGVEAYYSNPHRVALDGLREGEPVVDKEIKSNAEASSIAMRKVLESIYRRRTFSISSRELLHAIPEQTIIEIVGAPYGISGNHVLDEIEIRVTSSEFDVSGSTTSSSDALYTAFRQLLGVENISQSTQIPQSRVYDD